MERIYNETIPHVDEDIIFNFNMGIIDIQNVKERGQLPSLFFYMYYHDCIIMSSKVEQRISSTQHNSSERTYVCYWANEAVTLIDYDNTMCPYSNIGIKVTDVLITALKNFTSTYNIKYYKQTNV